MITVYAKDLHKGDEFMYNGELHRVTVNEVDPYNPAGRKVLSYVVARPQGEQQEQTVDPSPQHLGTCRRCSQTYLLGTNCGDEDHLPKNRPEFLRMGHSGSPRTAPYVIWFSASEEIKLERLGNE